MADLIIEGLCCRFHRPVLTGVDLTVPSGRLTAILGASGSGKTTLLRLICGFNQPSAGSISIGGTMMAGPGVFVPPERRHVGYVAQDGALFPHLSVGANILFGLSRAERRDDGPHGRAAELLRLVGLPPDYASRPPQHLSGGEQQRVALARALAPAPPLVLLDEPFSALDAALRADTRRAVAAALQAVGATALLVTHDQSEALSMGHEVAVLRDGVLVQVAAPTELYQHPVDPALARFLGEAVLLPGTAQGRRIDCRLGTLHRAAAAPDGAVEVLIRPEQIRLLDAADAGLCGTVAEVTYYGHDASVRLELEGLPGLTARVSGHAAPAVGTRQGIAIDGDVVAYGREK
jgi:iron(III) transport system ATP-binding protein